MFQDRDFSSKGQLLILIGMLQTIIDISKRRQNLLNSLWPEFWYPTSSRQTAASKPRQPWGGWAMPKIWRLVGLITSWPMPLLRCHSIQFADERSNQTILSVKFIRTGSPNGIKFSDQSNKPISENSFLMVFASEWARPYRGGTSCKGTSRAVAARTLPSRWNSHGVVLLGRNISKEAWWWMGAAHPDRLQGSVTFDTTAR